MRTYISRQAEKYRFRRSMPVLDCPAYDPHNGAMEHTPGQWTGGPYSRNFPEREAARLAREGYLRLDPDGSVWRVRKLDAVRSPIVPPTRIDYGPEGGHRCFKIRANGHYWTVSVARFVWQMHKGDIPDRLTVNHKDGKPARNVIDNLELATHSEQHAHRYTVLGHEAPSKALKRLCEGFAQAARDVLATGNLDELRNALQAYENRSATLSRRSRSDSR